MAGSYRVKYPVLALVDHGLDGEDVAGGHDAVVVAVLVVQDVGVVVEDLAHAVAAEVLGRGEPLLGDDVLDDAADLRVGHARLADGDGGLPGLVRGLDQVLARRVHLPHAEHLAAVAVVAVVEDRHVDVDHVAVQQQRGGGGDAVADDLVDAGADALWVPLVVERGGVCPPLHRLLVHKLVDLVRRHSHPERFPGHVQNFSCHARRNADSINIFLRVCWNAPWHHRGASFWLAIFPVIGLHDRVGNRSLRAENPGSLSSCVLKCVFL
mmetsp:Transcript_82607/g.221499  ORF Transcript_82607/g.221499 Transcript_82607/m.221499 type:complete len:267 (+) Transcript_82607:310-1110(+)